MPTKKARTTKKGSNPPPTLDICAASPLPSSVDGVYIDRLPFELLSKIFRICQSDLVDERTTKPEDEYAYSSVFSSVSTYWRDVAVGTPELWCTIHLTDAKTRRHARNRLERSRREYLNINITSPDLHVVQPNVKLIRPHLDRTRTLKIDMTRGGCGFHINPATHLPAFSVHILSLSLISVKFASATTLLNILHGCPSLRELDLTDSVALDLDRRRPGPTTSRAPVLLRLQRLTLPSQLLKLNDFVHLLLAPSLRHIKIIPDPVSPDSQANMVTFRGLDCSATANVLNSGVLVMSNAVAECDHLTVQLSSEDTTILRHVNLLMAMLGPSTLHALLVSTVGVLLPSFCMPKLRTIRLDNFPSSGPLEVLTYRFPRCFEWLHGPSSGSVFPTAFPGTGCPCPLQRLEVSGKKEPAVWSEIHRSLTRLGVEIVANWTQWSRINLRGDTATENGVRR